MKVTVKLFATLKELMPEGQNQMTVEVEDEATVDDLALQLDIPEEKDLIVKVNGRHGSRNTVLEAGDRVGIFPPVGGG
ncbi:MoaD/ThiS family protein [Halanaerobacter jeridensis]|uniref:Molybdopterin converting factor small subunit n=1 Tax=Halanaerobacter jeridensis TaxID=706427 RepID=A0A939BPZ3_9FIRM|nr:MoaD/ThiS family protein [Halanaerobacter jeridensis]MBM7557677.1 molybdopterin converting factor small subunit [Halanaerobacter jeridensis]